MDSTRITALVTLTLADPGVLVTHGLLVLRLAKLEIETEFVTLSRYGR